MATTTRSPSPSVVEGGPRAATAVVSLTRPSYCGKGKVRPQAIVVERPMLRLVRLGRSLRRAPQFLGFSERREAQLRLRIDRHQPPERLGSTKQRFVDAVADHGLDELAIFRKCRLVDL